MPAPGGAGNTQQAQSARDATIATNKATKSPARLAAEIDWLKLQINYANTVTLPYASSAVTTASSILQRFFDMLGLSPRDTTKTAITQSDLTSFFSSWLLINPYNPGTLEYGWYPTNSENIAAYTARMNKAEKTLRSSVTTAKAAVTATNNKITAWTAALGTLQATQKPFTATDFTKLMSGTNIVAQNNAGGLTLIYNCSPAKDAYFSSKEQFHYLATSKTYKNPVASQGYHVVKGNIPKQISSSDLMTLWSDSSAYKGMIAPWKMPNDPGTNKAVNPILPITTSTTAAGKTTTKNMAGIEFDAANGKRYGFQFHYNPATIDMSYQGTPDIDVAYEVSGSEQFGYIGGVGATQSTISFDILINRMYDMKYLNTDGSLKAGLSKSDIWPGKSPTDQELVTIHRKGTMYDVDFLLRALLGYGAKQVLRTVGNEVTADIGYVGAVPVELHIGKGLRYIGFINGLTLHHTIFNEDMVPLFTMMRFSFNRIPDFPVTKA